MKSSALTDIGSKRKINQDSIFSTDDAIGKLPNLYIVADGMGGHKAGDYASRECIEAMTSYIKEYNDICTPISVLEYAIYTANINICNDSRSNQELEGMGTTVVAATVVDGMIYVANVGDSRLYIVQDNNLIQLTQDHSLVEEMVKRGEITESDARIHPNKNIITRALGSGDNVVVDFFEIEADKVDRVLLCSDGLTNMVDDTEIMDVILHSDNIEKATRILVDKANKYGGKDNISVILVEM
ncbi:MAG: Stp1/IreP family PP2C-type Ser/Thr phosphatase [Lachnospiraceae bacterium]|nr:Stp1/IreP family PP2C-type Ser/Thr phosphatase [Lachnospiraceae bacterium]